MQMRKIVCGQQRTQILVFKLSPCCSNEKLSSGYFPGRRGNTQKTIFHYSTYTKLSTFSMDWWCDCVFALAREQCGHNHLTSTDEQQL